MGSSKGKDILFFGLIGLFLILSQIGNSNYAKKHLKFLNIKNSNKYLKKAIILALITMILGIFVEILLRLYLNINLNTIFVSMNPTMASTSILHSHVYKSIFGTLISLILGSFIPIGINTGSSLYQYIPSIANFFILLLPILFIFEVLSIQSRPSPTTLLLSFFSSCLLIGILDGGMFATPCIVGFFGLYLIYRNAYYFDYYCGKILKNRSIQEEANLNHRPYSPYRIKKNKIKFIFNRSLPYIFIFIYLVLRLTITLMGANVEYYEVIISDPSDNIDINNYTTIKIENTTDKTIIHFSPEYNELDLLNSLKIPLKNKCDYYTLSWNGYSYF